MLHQSVQQPDCIDIYVVSICMHIEDVFFFRTAGTTCWGHIGVSKGLHSDNQPM